MLAAGGWVTTLGDGGGRLAHGIVKLWSMDTCQAHGIWLDVGELTTS